MPTACAAGALMAAVTVGTPAVAAPQWTAGWQTGACGLSKGSSWGWKSTCWFNALYADVLFGRERSTDWGIGPHIEAATAGFSDVRLGGGATLQIPLTEHLGTTLSVSGLAMEGNGWSPGIGSTLFIGSRNYNFHSVYGLTAGLVLGMQRRFGDHAETTWIAAAQIDLQLLAMPFLLLYGAMK